MKSLLQLLLTMFNFTRLPARFQYSFPHPRFKPLGSFRAETSAIVFRLPSRHLQVFWNKTLHKICFSVHKMQCSVWKQCLSKKKHQNAEITIIINSFRCSIYVLHRTFHLGVSSNIFCACLYSWAMLHILPGQGEAAPATDGPFYINYTESSCRRGYWSGFCKAVQLQGIIHPVSSHDCSVTKIVKHTFSIFFKFPFHSNYESYLKNLLKILY